MEVDFTHAENGITLGTYPCCTRDTEAAIMGSCVLINYWTDSLTAMRARSHTFLTS